MFSKKQTQNRKGLSLASLAGLGSGIILALLFAPSKGTAIYRMVGGKRVHYLNAIKKGKDLLTSIRRTKSYEDWTREELLREAESVGINGYSQMYKDELIWALRHR